MQTRFALSLSEEAAAILLKSTNGRNKGKWLSETILNCARGTEIGVTERMAQRLARIEHKIDGLVEFLPVIDVGTH